MVGRPSTFNSSPGRRKQIIAVCHVLIHPIALDPAKSSLAPDVTMA
jgi:hypothetical protein